MGGLLFKNKYRIPSTRLEGWNYSFGGFYFVTICTKEMKNYFGKVVDSEMILNVIGKVVHEEWGNIFQLRENLVFDEFVIMPNHVHGIVFIKEKIKNVETHFGVSRDTEINKDKNIRMMPEKYQGVSKNDEKQNMIDNVETHQGAIVLGKDLNQNLVCRQETHQGASVHNNDIGNLFGPMEVGSLSSIINQFKAAVKRWCNKNGYKGFQWQPRYYDRVIRNEYELERIREYIKNNPANWGRDKNLIN